MLEAQKKYGNKWSDIAKLLNGRPENSVKNRFNCLCKKEKEELIKKSTANGNLNDALQKAVNNEGEDRNWLDLLINKKKVEAASKSHQFVPLQERVKQEITTFLSNESIPVEQELIDQDTCSSTCPNFRYLLRKNMILKESEKFINPVTRQVVYVHPIGVYIEHNCSNIVI